MKISLARDNLLFAPGPLMIGRPVRPAILRERGSRDIELVDLVRHRSRLPAAGSVAAPWYEAVLIQDSGTFNMASVSGSTVRPGVSCGHHAQRIRPAHCADREGAQD